MSIWECKVPSTYDQLACGCLPPGFSRLRYFFGKHLNVADFIDEQRYHRLKNRFHNQRLHGAGVICGLSLSLLEADGTIVRVAKGAALDRCGNEIIVAYDQCIDVNAWYQEERQRRLQEDPSSTWPADQLNDDAQLPICILLRYHECPTQPEPAPRDPCSCAEGGCEYGRVSEDYILDLAVADEAMAMSHQDSFPTQNQIADALANATGGVDLLRRLAEPVTEACPQGIEDTALLLGCFNALLSTPDNDAIGAIENLGEHYVPPILLSTEVIQYLLAQIVVDLEVDVGAPAIIEVQWLKTATGYQFILLLDSELEAVTIDERDAFGLRKLTNEGWDPPPANALSAAYRLDDEVPGPAIYISVDESVGFLEDGGRYQLFINSAQEPMVDAELRQLRPHAFVWRFRLVEDTVSGDLLMESPPFSINR